MEEVIKKLEAELEYELLFIRKMVALSHLTTEKGEEHIRKLKQRTSCDVAIAKTIDIRLK